MCTNKDTLAHYLGTPSIDDVMRHKTLITTMYKLLKIHFYIFCSKLTYLKKWPPSGLKHCVTSLNWSMAYHMFQVWIPLETILRINKTLTKKCNSSFFTGFLCILWMFFYILKLKHMKNEKKKKILISQLLEKQVFGVKIHSLAYKARY